MDRQPQATDTALPLPAWGHASGLIRLGEASAPFDTAACADRFLITERLARYCWSYDERRVELLGACFTEDGVWEGNVLGRIPIGPFTGRERIAAWLSEFWPHQKDQRRHMLLNTLVEAQTPQTAATLSYLILMSSKGEHPSVETVGFYRTEQVKVGEQWLIRRLTAGFDAPFWPGNIDKMSARGRARHGVNSKGEPENG